jgi:hypothetical protein
MAFICDLYGIDMPWIHKPVIWERREGRWGGLSGSLMGGGGRRSMRRGDTAMRVAGPAILIMDEMSPNENCWVRVAPQPFGLGGLVALGLGGEAFLISASKVPAMKLFSSSGKQM